MLKKKPSQPRKKVHNVDSYTLRAYVEPATREGRLPNPERTKMEYHELVAMLRARSGMTLSEVAEAADVSAANLGRIERGEVSPRMTTAMKILEVLGIDGIWEEIDRVENIEQFPSLLRAAAGALEEVLPILLRLKMFSKAEMEKLEAEKVAEDGPGYREEENEV